MDFITEVAPTMDSKMLGVMHTSVSPRLHGNTDSANPSPNPALDVAMAVGTTTYFPPAALVQSHNAGVSPLPPSQKVVQRH